MKSAYLFCIVSLLIAVFLGNMEPVGYLGCDREGLLALQLCEPGASASFMVFAPC